MTSLAIDAADTLTGKGGTLLSSVVGSRAAECPRGMVPVAGVTFSCADAYEVSAAPSCPHVTIGSALDTQANIDTTECQSQSAAESLPWVYVTREQARTLCARRGARLPTSAEWYQLALGARDSKGVCNTTGGSVATAGAFPSCVTESKLYDLIGNVWEWTIDDVIDGVWNGRSLPPTGYVTQVDQSGVAVVTGAVTEASFYNDYFWSSTHGAFGMMRGGFYGSQDDAGVYALHAETLPTTAGAAIGFRCVQ
ncbi:MAG: hypothetical protein RLZZ234_760 [Candidatus Parcubacteria bacterium]